MRKLVVFGKITSYFYYIYLEQSGLYTVDVSSGRRQINLTALTLEQARQLVKEVTS